MTIDPSILSKLHDDTGLTLKQQSPEEGSTYLLLTDDGQIIGDFFTSTDAALLYAYDEFSQDKGLQ